MAQETRIGLLVGMGFIVCFAVILSNRGGLDRVAPQMPYQLFGGPAAPPPRPAGMAAQERARSMSLEGSLAPRATRDAGPSSVEEADLRLPSPTGGDASPLPRNSVPAAPPGADNPERFIQRRRSLLPTRELAAVDAAATNHNTAHEEISSPGEALASAAPVQTGAAEPNGAETHHSAEDSPLTESAAPLPAVLAGFADRLEVVTPSGSRASAKPQPKVGRSAAEAQRSDGKSQEPRPAKTSVSHVIDKGDTLSRIAQRYYGTTSKEVLTAILEANRATIRSRNALVVGRTLRLPTVGERIPDAEAGQAAPATEKGNASVTPHPLPSTQPTQPQSWRWYTVKKGDLYSTIAQQQLGTSKRWKELVALNKDVCPDARQLRQGVQIRIPGGALADAR